MVSKAFKEKERKFEAIQISRVLNRFVVKGILKRERERYSIEPDVDLLFRGKLIRSLKQPKGNGAQILCDAAVEVLEEYDVLEDEGVTLENFLMVRIFLTFGNNVITKKILAKKEKTNNG